METVKIAPKGRWAVIVVDVQGDFTELENGALAVSGTGADYINDVVNETKLLHERGFQIYATQDWHPANHCSFARNHPGKKIFDVVEIDGRQQVLWPTHCVQNTNGARILLPDRLIHQTIRKGTDPNFDSYSGFADDGGAPTGLEDILKDNGIDNLIIYGLATDYCVRFTAIDGAKLGFNVTVVEDLCRGVDPKTSASAIKEMKESGVRVVKSLDLSMIK